MARCGKCRWYELGRASALNPYKKQCIKTKNYVFAGTGSCKEFKNREVKADSS